MTVKKCGNWETFFMRSVKEKTIVLIVRKLRVFSVLEILVYWKYRAF